MTLIFHVDGGLIAITTVIEYIYLNNEALLKDALFHMMMHDTLCCLDWLLVVYINWRYLYVSAYIIHIDLIFHLQREI